MKAKQTDTEVAVEQAQQWADEQKEIAELTKQEEKNLKAIYRIQSVPSDTQMRTMLDPLSPAPLRTLFAKLFNKLSESGVIKEYEYWKGQLVKSCQFCLAIRNLHISGSIRILWTGISSTPSREKHWTPSFDRWTRLCRTWC